MIKCWFIWGKKISLTTDKMLFVFRILHPCVLPEWDLLTVMDELLLRRVWCVWFVGKRFGCETDCLSEMHVANADCVFWVLSNASNVSNWKYCNGYLMWRNHDTNIPLQITIIIIFVIHLYWGTQQMGIMGKWRCPFFFWNKKLALCYCGQLVPGGLCKYCDQFKRGFKFESNCNNNPLAQRVWWICQGNICVCVWICVCLFGGWGGGAERFLPVCLEESRNCCHWCCCQSWLIFSLICLLNMRITIHARQLSTLHKP